jgi:hypothetical protein
MNMVSKLPIVLRFSAWTDVLSPGGVKRLGAENGGTCGSREGSLNQGCTAFSLAVVFLTLAHGGLRSSSGRFGACRLFVHQAAARPGWFHQTIQNEFYAIAFRRKVYASPEQLQADVDECLDFYNRERTHPGKHCLSKIPCPTFLDTKTLAENKQLDRTPPTPSSTAAEA